MCPDVGDEAVISSGTVNMTADAVVGELTLSGGTLTGAFDLSANTIVWSSGQMTGSGSTTATSAVDFTGTDQIYLNDRTFNNAGVATWNRTGSLYFNSAASTFNNQLGATFSVVNAGGTVVYGNGTFNNAGTFTMSSAGSTILNLIFNNYRHGQRGVGDAGYHQYCCLQQHWELQRTDRHHAKAERHA